MENLVLLGEKRRRLVIPSSDPVVSLLLEQSKITDLCTVFTDPDTPCTVVLTENGVAVKIESKGSSLWACNLSEVSEIDGGWFQVDIIDQDIVCLSKHGAIVTINPSTGEAELVGIFDQGLEDAVWSPDKETLLMVTSTEENDEESLAEASDEGATKEIHSRLMTMNTQFEVLAEVTIPKYVPSSTSSDAAISLAWRPDGALCGVSTVDAEDGTRKIRIYKRETLDLHAIGRAEDASGALVKNLQQARIAWASTGCSQLLAGVQRKGKKTHQVVFFEPNGLRHREFVLRETPTTNVSSLQWNTISDLLAISLSETDGSDKIQLWHRSNYHWYLKREFRYEGLRIERLQFNDGNPYELRVLLHGLEWREYEVRWDPSTISAIEERCNAFVIDGSSVNVTDFHKAVIPPPMFAKSYSLNLPISEVSFCCEEPYRGSCLISLSNGGLVFLKYEATNSTFTPVQLQWKQYKDVDLSALRSFAVVKTAINRLHAVCLSSASCNEENEKLVEVLVEDLDDGKPMASIINTVTLNGRGLRLTQWLDASGGCLLQLNDGSLFEYETNETGGTLMLSKAEPLIEACPWFSAIKESFLNAKLTLEDDRSRVVVGLSRKSRLYFHEVMLSDSVASFAISLSHGFLCYTTEGSRCHSRFINLKEMGAFDPLMGTDQSNLLEGYEPRKVEQGAKVVAVLPATPQMILQMPRGNLEGICPRALILCFVITKVIEGAYGEAFRMMRKHKVDLNLLVDLDPQDFLEGGISRFLREVNNIDHLNLFISNLQNHDITQTRFPIPAWLDSSYERKAGTFPFDFSTKVNQVCEKARAVMMSIEVAQEKPERHFLLPILSTFAKEDPPKLCEALRLIKENSANEPVKTKSTKNPLFSESAQQSIHYLAFLAEYELLFETALGMYDFEMARAVARNSQMDPKIYLPLLKRYNDLPTYFSRYEVDTRLQRFDFALRNLHQSFLDSERMTGGIENETVLDNSFDNCLAFMNTHKLHKVGLELFRDDPERKRSILIALGDLLLDQKQPKVAANVYLTASPPNWEGAKRASRASKDWRLYFSLFERRIEQDTNGSSNNSDFQSEKRRQAAREIAKEIASSTTFSTTSMRSCYLDAARILIDYGDDWIGAMDFFVQAEFWSEGYRLAKLYTRPDLQKKCVDGAVAFAQASLTNFSERLNEFDDANTRYAEVLKLRKQTMYVEGPEPSAVDQDENDETGSLFSLASTVSNRSLQSTTSAGSTGSAMSSVISIKSTTTFQMTGSEDTDRHRSKFNKGKKPKNKRNKKPRQKPGGQQELKELVGILKASCPSDEYATTISETIRFLLLAQHAVLAEQLYTSYREMCHGMEKARAERMQTNKEEKSQAMLLNRSQGESHELSYMLVEHPVEQEVDKLLCSSLDTDLDAHFDYVLS